MEESEGMCSYYASDLFSQLLEKALEKLFSGDLPSVVFPMLAMEVDENNGLGTVEATRLHREGMNCDDQMLYLLKKMKYCCTDCRTGISAQGKIYSSVLLLAG